MSLHSPGIVTVTGGVGGSSCKDQVGTGVTQLKFVGTGVAITTPVSGVSTVIITSNGPSDIDDHIQVGKQTLVMFLLMVVLIINGVLPPLF